jgi:hypothetical protein
MTHLIREHSTHVRTPDGRRYVARSFGKPEPDGVWTGWLEFAPVDTSGPVLRTDRETSQASREALESWALGLEPAYFEGAFARARLVEE